MLPIDLQLEIMNAALVNGQIMKTLLQVNSEFGWICRKILCHRYEKMQARCNVWFLFDGPNPPRDIFTNVAKGETLCDVRKRCRLNQKSAKFFVLFSPYKSKLPPYFKLYDEIIQHLPGHHKQVCVEVRMRGRP